MSATAILINTCVWHLTALATNEETIPAHPVDISITHYGGGMLIASGSPRIIKHGVVIAGVKRNSFCCGNISNING